MGIQPVRPGEKITAQAWNDMATAINNQLTADGDRQWGRSVPVTITNRTIAARNAGQILTVYKGGTVRLANYDPDEARLAWMNSGFQLDGYGASANDYGTPALLIDGISPGGIGRAIVPGLCAGFLTYTETTLPELCKFDADTGSFVSAGANEVGDWKIIAASAGAPNNAKRVFCYLVPASIQDLQKQADKLGWGNSSSSSSSSSSGDDFADKIRDYFDCSDAIKDPVLYYDDGENPAVHPEKAVWNILPTDGSSDGPTPLDSDEVKYVLISESADDGQEAGWEAYGCEAAAPDRFLAPGSGTMPSEISVSLGTTASDNSDGVDVLTAVNGSNVTFLTGVTPTSSRPNITVSGTFVTSVGEAVSALSGVTPTTGSVGIAGTNGTSPLSAVAISGGGAALTTTQNENEGIEVVTGISCVNGQLAVTTALLKVVYTSPTLDPTTTTLSITGGSSVITALTPSSVSVVKANTASTGSPTAALASDVLTAITPASSTNTLVSGVTTTRIGATLHGIHEFCPTTHPMPTGTWSLGELVRGEPVIHTKRSNAVTTSLLDCGESSSSSSSSSSSESSSESGSSSGEGESDPPEPEPTTA